MKRNEIRKLLCANTLAREEVLRILQNNSSAHKIFLKLTSSLQEEFLLFCEGKTSLWICYDVFFKSIFHPDTHRQRLERLLSAILGQEVRILETMSSEGTHISDRGSFVIMDLVVRLADGSIVNLEIQKIGYKFPAKRFDCYCADLIIREYSRLKIAHGKKFSYSEMPLVYSIVLFEQSPEEFRTDADHFIHFGQMQTDTGITPNSIARHVYVTLDIFKQQMQNKPISTPLEAWLTLLTTQDPERIGELIERFEGFGDIYREIFQLRTKPEELIKMYENIFYEADRNEDRMIIEEMQEKLAAQSAATAIAIAEKDSAIAEKDSAIAEKDSAIAEKDSAITDLKTIIDDLKAVIDNLQLQLQSK